MPGKPSGRHVAALDGLRGCAIAAVMIHEGPRSHDGLGARLLAAVSQGGWAGVQLFFVLSGFLITGILLDTREEPRFFRNFYARRTLRIFPAYYVMLVLTLLVGPLVFSTESAGVQAVLSRQAWLWTYTSNIGILLHNGWCFNAGWLNLDHTWSLAVEEQFYLAWPVLVFFLPRRGIVALGLAIVVASPVVRTLMFRGGVSPEAVYSFTLCRLDALAIGSLVAVFLRGGAEPGRQLRVARGIILGGGVALSCVILACRGFDSEELLVQTAGFSVLAVFCSGVVLLAAIGAPETRFVRVMSSPALTFIGRYSYGMYLYQGMLAPLFHKIPVDRIAALLGSRLAAVLVGMALMFVVTIAVAFASWHLLERPFLALKSKFAR